MPPASPLRRGNWLTPILVLALALGLTYLFWPTLWSGGGLVGGDIYYYVLPQKAFYADCLRNGELPLWNPLVGHGYPQLAESQTGALYPPFLVLYSFCDLNTAFNVSVLGHYVLAFGACWLYARRIGLSGPAAAYTALIYTYGWFPPRVSLEWAIVGGAWLPLALWLAESCLQTRRWRYGLGLTVVCGVQLLAGHFLIAFLTQLALLAYIPARLWWGGETISGVSQGQRWRLGFALGVAVATAFPLAAAQLLPTWELKNQSQRVGVTEEHNPGYGYIPPAYLAQIVAPWWWYESEQRVVAVADPQKPRTNWVEAHLYFGLLPLPLMVWGLVDRRSLVDWRVRGLWLAIGGAGAVYATGILVPLTNHLPGFSFFEGPGRYGILTTLGGAVLAGAGFAAVARRIDGTAYLAWLAVAFGGTAGDLWLVSQRVTHAVAVEVSPIVYREQSPIREFLAREGAPTRMLNEGKNLPSIVGAGTLPVYLGLGPAAYYDPELMLENPLPFRDQNPTAGQLEWLRQHGVTHVLSLTEVELGAWPAKEIWFGADVCLNIPLARAATHGFYLYEIVKGRGRVAWVEAELGPAPTLRRYEPTRVEVEVNSDRGGTVVLTDLAYPGWDLTLDGKTVAGEVIERQFRGVRVTGGKHTIVWTYVPRSVYWGSGISVTTLLTLLVIGHVHYWHRVRLPM